MACQRTAPINLIKSATRECQSRCNLSYDYGLSDCSVINKGVYLDINCYNGSNTVNSDLLEGLLTVTGVRLYKPSLNKYENFKADAELIITHTGGGRTLYMCIPVVGSGKVGSSAKWFNKFIPFSPKQQNRVTGINVNGYTLNSVIPQSPYIIYEGGSFDWNCGQDNIIIMYHKDNAINMSNANMVKLGKLISASSTTVVNPVSNLLLSSAGTTAGPGRNASKTKKKVLKCRPVTYPDGSPIIPGKASDLPWSGGEGSEGASTKVGSNSLMWAIIILLAIIVLVLLGRLLGLLFTTFINSSSRGSGSTSAG